KIELIGRGLEPELHELARVMAAGEQKKDVVLNGRVYGAYPHFRDAAIGIPDEFYDVTAELAVCQYLSDVSWAGTRLRLTGHAHIEHVDSVAAITLILRQRGDAGECRIEMRPSATGGLTKDCGQGLYDYGPAGFHVELDLAELGRGPLSPGHWGLFVAVT